MPKFTYFYFMNDASNQIREIAPKHAAYWHSLNLPDYEGGPFADRTGGLISFTAVNQQGAAEFVADDPFIQNELLASHWLKEWLIE